MPHQHANTSPPSTIAAYAFAIASALEQQAIDPKAIFAEAGVALQTTTDPMRRLSNGEVSRLFQASVAATGDPAFGIVVGESLHPGNLHALGYALMASTSLRDFCQRLQHYYHIVSQSADISTVETADEFVLTTRIASDDLCLETQDAFVTLMLRFIRFIYRPSFQPLRLCLVRPEPEVGVQQYYDKLATDLVFSHDTIVIAMPASIVDQPLPGASRELALMHDQTAMRYLQHLAHRDISNRVRTAIVEELASSAVTKQRVADKLCMSARSLQMKLAARDTSFQAILDDTRHSLALAYLEQSNMSITETAYLLGFSDVSNFTRAFKRWTDQSPRHFRQSMGMDH